MQGTEGAGLATHPVSQIPQLVVSLDDVSLDSELPLTTSTLTAAFVHPLGREWGH